MGSIAILLAKKLVSGLSDGYAPLGAHINPSHFRQIIDTTRASVVRRGGTSAEARVEIPYSKCLGTGDLYPSSPQGIQKGDTNAFWQYFASCVSR